MTGTRTALDPARDGLGRFVADTARRTDGVMCVACCHALPDRASLVRRLGRELARRDFKTLVVDADHLDPEMHLYMDTPATPGLAQLLAGTVTSTKDALHEVEDGLWLLPAGLTRASATVLAGLPETDALLEDLATEYAAVLLVPPPVLSDAAGAEGCSGSATSLLAVRKGITRKEEVEAAAARLREHGSAIAGVVMVA